MEGHVGALSDSLELSSSTRQVQAAAEARHCNPQQGAKGGLSD